MKHYLSTAFCALALLLACACERPEDRVRDVAETFLNAYFTGDFAAAADFCTPRLAHHVIQGAQPLEQLPSELEQKMKEAVRQTSFNIVSVEVDEEAGTAVVRYTLSGPGLEKPVPKSMTLQLEGRTALVDRIE